MTDGEVLVTLGGPSKVARQLGVSTDAAHNWSKRGIPWRHRHKVVTLLVTGGHSVPAGFLERGL